MLKRSQWLDTARKLDWPFSYVDSLFSRGDGERAAIDVIANLLQKIGVEDR